MCLFIEVAFLAGCILRVDLTYRYFALSASSSTAIGVFHEEKWSCRGTCVVYGTVFLFAMKFQSIALTSHSVAARWLALLHLFISFPIGHYVK